MMGLEPTTSSMPWRRSTRLSYIPEREQGTSELPRFDLVSEEKSTDTLAAR